MTFKEKCNGLPSNAVDAMVQGLRDHAAKPNGRIYVKGFLAYKGDFCFACAATCAIQRLLRCDLLDFRDCAKDMQKARAEQLDLTYLFPVNAKYRALFTGWPIDVDHLYDMQKFEEAIDNLRSGYPGPFFTYFAIRATYVMPSGLPTLDDKNWSLMLPFYERFRDHLKAHGL